VPKTTAPITIKRFDHCNDGRGESYRLPPEALDFLGGVAEMHVATIEPGAVRGNHSHRARREIILLSFTGRCKLAWRPEGGETRTREFRDPGAVLLSVESGTAHAIQNTGDQPVRLISCSNGEFDPEKPDTIRQALL
jgi:dTDP-4-dehydrorhamnose 3,5-epimerase-like enzyme